MKVHLVSWVLFVTLLAGGAAWAGGSGLNVIVVVNANSTNSLALGNDYCERRGVPPQNVLRITNWTGGAINWSPSQFTNYLRNPLLALIANRGLTNQAQFVLLAMDIPYRVTDGSSANSTTSALFYGFKTNGAPVAGYASCSLPDNSSNSYCYAELPFRQAPPNTAPTNAFLAMLLTDTNLARAEAILRSGVAADSTFPTQFVRLQKTSDTTRNIRFLEADNAVFESQVAGNYAVTRLTSDATTLTNLTGWQTGLANFTLATNALVGGALADSLTSSGGYIFENSGQTPLLAFLEAGAAGSYGTVVEPCNYLQKFPDPIDYFYQARGFALAEAYYQSVQNPFQGLLVGEPLTAPFARPGLGSWNTLTNGATLSGTATLGLSFTSAATNLPLAQVDLFVDGTFLATLTNLPPAPGNLLSAVVNGTTCTYTLQATDTLASAAAGLAAAINQQTNTTQVLAYAAGDRIELQSHVLNAPGSTVTLAASASPGAAASLTTGLTAARPTFLDTVATGYQYVTVSANTAPLVGDWLQCTLIKTNTTIVTVGVTNTTAGTSLNTLVQNLMNQINSNAALTGANGVLASDYIGGSPVQFFLNARTVGRPASQILATFNSSTNLQVMPTGSNPLADNASDLFPRNHLYLSSGLNALAVNAALDTTALADGWHQLTAVAYEGTSVRTQTRTSVTVQIQNTSLAATLTTRPAGSNAALTQPLQFTITASQPNMARIELFSTGGLVAVATNQATADFTLVATNLGLGLHPFYALVTDQLGHRYQTPTLSYRLFPPITLALTGVPPVLSWPATPGYQYAVQATTSLPGNFQTVATITATNTLAHWALSPTNGAAFYRVQLVP